MLKLLVKLAIVALVANALFRVGTEYLTYIKFRDSIRDAAMFRATTDEELKQEIMKLSDDYEIPLVEDELTIERSDRHVVVQGSYKKKIEVVPTFQYDWPFNWSLDIMTPTTVPYLPRRR